MSLIFDTLTISGNGMVGPSTAAVAGTSRGTATLTSTSETVAPLDQATPNTTLIKMKIKVDVTGAAVAKLGSSSLPTVSMSAVSSDGNPALQTAAWNSQPANPFAFDATAGTYPFKRKDRAFRPL